MLHASDRSTVAAVWRFGSGAVPGGSIDRSYECVESMWRERAIGERHSLHTQHTPRSSYTRATTHHMLRLAGASQLKAHTAHSTRRNRVTPEVLEPYLSLHLCPMPSTKHVLHTCTPRRVAARWPCCTCRVRLPPLGLLDWPPKSPPPRGRLRSHLTALGDGSKPRGRRRAGRQALGRHLSCRRLNCHWTRTAWRSRSGHCSGPRSARAAGPCSVPRTGPSGGRRSSRSPASACPRPACSEPPEP